MIDPWVQAIIAVEFVLGLWLTRRGLFMRSGGPGPVASVLMLAIGFVLLAHSVFLFGNAIPSRVPR